MEYVYKRLPLIYLKHFTSAVNYLRGEGAQSIPPDIKKIMEDSNLWGENIEEDFMNSIEETDPQFLNNCKNGICL
jgi:thioredoxin reductase